MQAPRPRAILALVSEFQREVIASDRAPAAVGNYNQGVVVSGGRTAYLSGQIGMVPGKPEAGIPGGVEDQTRQIMANISAVLEAANMSLANVVRATIYLADIADFTRVDQVYGAAFDGASFPSRVTIQAANLPKGARVEISVIAVG